MDFTEPPKLLAFRERVRTWLDENLPPGWGSPGYDGPRTAADRVAFAKQWQGKLHEGGWAGISWPVESMQTESPTEEEFREHFNALVTAPRAPFAKALIKGPTDGKKRGACDAHA